MTYPLVFIFIGNSQLLDMSNSHKEVSSTQVYEHCALYDKESDANKWLEQYKVPIQKFPRSTSEKLLNEKRLNPAEYREVIRIVAADILYVEEKPVKKHLETVAKKFVLQFPVMEDCIDGVKIGSGYDGFYRKLVARVENVRRPCAYSLKRKVNKVLISDNFSCPNFLPDIAINEESLCNKRELLKNEYCSQNWKLDTVYELMEETFSLQRLSVSQKIPMSQLKSDWPYLFFSKTMIGHFNSLMKKDVVPEYEKIFEKKLPELYSFMKMQDLKKKVTFEENHINFLEVLCAYFEEDFAEILNIFDVSIMI